MSYVNLDVDYFDHPKTKRLIAFLGQGAESLPLKLWCYCAKFSPRDGELSMTPEEMAAICDWPGDPSKMLHSLLSVSILDATGMPLVYKVHDWREFQGHIYALKVRNKNNAKKRWKKFRSLQSVVTKQLKHHASGMPVVCHVNAPNLTLPNLNNNISSNSISFAEVELFFKDNQQTKEEAQKFFNHYESLGWKSGNSWITNWKPKALNWIKNIKLPEKFVKKETKPKQDCDVCKGTGKLPDTGHRCWCW